MKDYVQLTSTVTITVPCGLQFDDFTKKDSDLPNRMNIQPNWPKMTIDIKEGSHWYPSMIMSWPVIMKYLEDGILAKVNEADTPLDTKDVQNGNTIKAGEVVEKKEELEQVSPEVFKEETKRRRRKSEDASLDQLAE